MRNRWCCPCCWLPASETARTNGGYSSVLPYTVWGSNLFQKFFNMFSESIMAAAVQPNGLWNCQKTVYKTFWTSCSPILYLQLTVAFKAFSTQNQITSEPFANISLSLPAGQHRACDTPRAPPRPQRRLNTEPSLRRILYIFITPK